MSEVILKETAMNPVGDARVGCGNLWDDDYTLPDGRTVHGMTATLAVAGTEDRMILGVGSVADIGGALWRLVAIDKQRGVRGTVTLRPVDEGVTWDGVDFGPKADLARLVLDHFVHGTTGTTLREDRTPLDWIGRAYDALRILDSTASARLARAVAGVFGKTLDPGLDALCVRFFMNRPGAPGGDLLAATLVADPERISESPDPVPGGIGLSVRQTALRTVVDWYRLHDRDVEPGLVDLLRREVAAGRGAGLVGSLAHVDPTYVDSHRDALLGAYPSHVDDIMDHLVAQGMARSAAVAAVLPFADVPGRRSLRYAVQLASSLSPAEKKALLAQIPEAPPAPSGPPAPPLYPQQAPKASKGSGAAWAALVAQGQDPLAALDQLLANAGAKEKKSLWDAVRNDTTLDPDDRQALIDRLMGRS